MAPEAIRCHGGFFEQDQEWLERKYLLQNKRVLAESGTGLATEFKHKASTVCVDHCKYVFQRDVPIGIKSLATYSGKWWFVFLSSYSS
mmetsp:Transcript_17839/g.49412  ORF Transcript_17839/g.49412 Transcript_17839/m.49412 type:complete len:88 (+) Transcript_17839:198-461(+)